MKRRSQECISPGPKRVADRYVDLRDQLGRKANMDTVMSGFLKVQREEGGCLTLRQRRRKLFRHLILHPTRHPRLQCQ